MRGITIHDRHAIIRDLASAGLLVSSSIPGAGITIEVDGAQAGPVLSRGLRVDPELRDWSLTLRNVTPEMVGLLPAPVPGILRVYDSPGLTSWDQLPAAGTNMAVAGCGIRSLLGFPTSINGGWDSIILIDTQHMVDLSGLEGITATQVDLHVPNAKTQRFNLLRAVAAKGIKHLMLYSRMHDGMGVGVPIFDDIQRIINDGKAMYASGQRNKAILVTQAALVRAGYPNLATL